MIQGPRGNVGRVKDVTRVDVANDDDRNVGLVLASTADAEGGNGSSSSSRGTAGGEGSLGPPKARPRGRTLRYRTCQESAHMQFNERRAEDDGIVVAQREGEKGSMLTRAAAPARQHARRESEACKRASSSVHIRGCNHALYSLPTAICKLSTPGRQVSASNPCSCTDTGARCGRRGKSAIAGVHVPTTAVPFGCTDANRA